MAEVTVPEQLFKKILTAIAALRPLSLDVEDRSPGWINRGIVRGGGWSNHACRSGALVVRVKHQAANPGHANPPAAK